MCVSSCYASVILTTWLVTLERHLWRRSGLALFGAFQYLKMGTRMLFRQADGMHSVVMILLKSFQSVTTCPNCPRSSSITTTGTLLFCRCCPHGCLPFAVDTFIPLSALSISSSLTWLFMPWLGTLSSVSTRGFSSFTSQLKYWPHRSLMYSSFISTSPLALLMVLICPMSFPSLSLAAAIL